MYPSVPIMSDMISFDGMIPICNLLLEELTDDRLFDNDFCNACGHSRDEHMRKRMCWKLLYYFDYSFIGALNYDRDSPVNIVLDFLYIKIKIVAGED